MALQTPRQRGLQRPSYGASTSPSLSASTSAAMNRKASLQALTGVVDPTTPAAHSTNSDLYVGDTVNVPGEMYGIVRYIGSVRGKHGTFAGVELDGNFASRGKNDGDVDGVSYFTTTIPGAGIFLPIHRAERRLSPETKISPATPTYSTTNGQRTREANNHTPSVSVPSHKFAKSVGPGVRPSSPTFKPSRPSLPRPESPLRKLPPNLAPTPGKSLSASQRGPRPGQTPSKTNLRGSTNVRPPTSQTPRPYSRSGSRLGSRGEDSILEDDRTPVGIATTSNGRTSSIGSIPSFSQPLRSPSRVGSSGGLDQEVQRLKGLLAERDQRLEEQATTLADMEKSVKELSNIIPQDAAAAAAMSRGSPGEHDDASSAQLRQIVREKNEKISMLTAEFDAHRADFRSTLDSLEMASTETERVYEEQKRDLLARISELEDMTQSREDFEGVARQLKQLEELVAELEEGLEESRRGEAEARGEVEFLRGEVERGRSELRREREKAATSESASASPSKELEQKDDEIRGLKAIIHGLSSNGSIEASVGNSFGNDKVETSRLQTALDESQRERENLERELEQLRRDAALTNGNGMAAHIRNESERTATAPESGTPIRPRSNTIKPLNVDRSHRSNNTPTLFCEMCEATDHDTLDCSKIHSEREETYSDAPDMPIHSSHAPGPYSPGGRGKENEDIAAAGGVNGKVNAGDEEKWCALCEKDGHLAFDCPEEQY